MNEKKKLTPSERVNLHDDRLLESGGRVLNKIRLKCEANEALKLLQGDSKTSTTEIINGLLIEAAEKQGKDL